MLKENVPYYVPTCIIILKHKILLKWKPSGKWNNTKKKMHHCWKGGWEDWGKLATQYNI